MNPKTLSILHAAGNLLSDPSKRCVGTLAEDSKGKPVAVTDTLACRWCLSGALQLAMHQNGVDMDTSLDVYDCYWAMKQALGLETNNPAPIYWDSNPHQHDEIASKLREAK